jgi:hypothetical protein
LLLVEVVEELVLRDVLAVEAAAEELVEYLIL